MNHTFHHFRKEARYLMPRWWPWLMLLGIELCLDLEWLVPLHAQGATWPAFAFMGTWGAGLLLAISSPPEDGAEQGFIATRPLPVLSYWLARVSVFAGMIALPLIMQEVLYLALSHRSAGEVFAGAGERALRVVSVLGWAAAMRALWQGWRLVAALVLSVVVVAWSLGGFLNGVGIGDSILLVWHVGIAAVAIGLLLVLVAVKRRLEGSVRAMVAAQGVGCVVVAWIASHWLPATWLDRATDQPRAEALAQQAQFSIPIKNLTFYPEAGGENIDGRFGGKLEAQPLPAVCDYWMLPKTAQARTTDNPLSTAVSRQPSMIFFSEAFLCSPDSFYDKGPALLSSMPTGTILVLGKAPGYPPSGRFAELPALQRPLPELDTPVTVEATFETHWLDWSPLLELPVQPGAEAATRDVQWKVKDIHFGKDGSGKSAPDAVTIECGGASSQGIFSQVGENTAFILHAPDRGLIWISAPLEWLPIARAPLSSWARQARAITWRGVLARPDGTAVGLDRSRLRLIVIQPRHLGTTSWTWQPPPMKLADHIREKSWGYSTNEHLNRGTEQQAFDARMASLTKPGATASTLEVHRYLWDVLSAARGLEFSEQMPPQHLRELLAEAAAPHLDDMLAMPDSIASDWANTLRDVLNPMLTDQHKPVLLEQLPKREWLAPIIAARGWTAEAVQALAPQLQGTRPLSVHLRKLLLSSNDPAVRQRLLDNFRRNPDEGYEVIDHLVRLPELRADLKTLADELWRGFQPVLGIKQDNRLRLAIKMGNAEALSIALRLAAMSDETAGSVHRLVFDLPRLLGLPQPPPNARPADLAPQYRALKASDFMYRTDTLLWEKKTCLCAMSRSFTTRFLVQLRADLRLLAWPALFTALIIVLRLRYRVPAEQMGASVAQLQQLTSSPISWLARLLPFALVLLALRADAPSNPDTASLTRPIGGGAQWSAKLAALFLTLCVPWLLCDLYVAGIPPHSAAGWLAILASSLGNTLFMVGVSAAIASLASSRRQLMLLAVVLIALWMLGGAWLKSLFVDTLAIRQRAPTLKSCAETAACGVAFIAVFSAWWLATVKRRQGFALAALAFGFVSAVVIGNAWPIDWLARPALKLDSKLALKLGQPAAGDTAPGQPLWPTLRITGLGKDEVCGILAFAPVIPDKPWPGGDFFTDFQPADPNPSRLQWLNNEHVRALLPHYATTDLWPLAERYHDPKRPALAQLIKRTNQPWRLRLAVHRLRRAGDLPLATVWHQAVDLPLGEGLALRLGPVRDHGEGSATTLHCGLHELRSTLLPPAAHAPIRMIKPSQIYRRDMPFNFILVAHDAEARENTFDFADMANYWGGLDSSWGLLVDRTNYRGLIFLHPPSARIGLGFTTEKDWLRTTTVQVWAPEERGIVDLDLSPEEVRQLLATPANPSPPSRSR